ncbi:serine-rich adhesin for platelets isoform X2 [Aplysia californica]|uniref:Serine-rich adhesin for platelets isoform X2 n=1 Tax=Aplysia californica TaxID=6500 RepID=A0ABM0JTW1_APLCA|nr:serine-rich adhesin for platelets isoform X2 [Aplysia californica]
MRASRGPYSSSLSTSCHICNTLFAQVFPFSYLGLFNSYYTVAMFLAVMRCFVSDQTYDYNEDTHLDLGQQTDTDAERHLSDSPLTTSSSKRVKMDGDGDGAPSSLETSPKRQKGEQLLKGPGDGGSSTISFDSSAESTPRGGDKKSSAQSTPLSSARSGLQGSPVVGAGDLSSLDMKTSWDGSASGASSTKGEAACATTGTSEGGSTIGYTVAFKARAGMLADPVKIAKEREKEERVRQARERLAEERRKKLEELKEQQRIAQENREKQLEMRRKKIEDLRRRDVERRAAVEERRKMKEEIERVRRESILQKAEERVARYEAWKAGGRKGGRGHMLGFGSATPRDICQPLERPRRSSSHSALVRRSPNGSDMDSVRPQRRALSACSAVRRHCCVDINRIGMFGGEGSTPKHLSMSTSVLYHKRNPEFSSMNALSPASRPESALVLNTIPEGRRSFLGTSPSSSAVSSGSSPYHYYRASTGGVGGAAGGAGATPPSRTTMTASMPSPVRMRDKAGPRKQRPASVASSMPSFVGGEPAKSPRSKSTDRAARDRSKTRPSRRESKDKENLAGKSSKSTPRADHDKDGDKDKTDGGEKAGKEKKGRTSLSFFERLATPKFQKGNQEPVEKEKTPKKDAPLVRVQFADDIVHDGSAEPELSPRKAYSTTNLATIRKRSSLREKPSPAKEKEATAAAPKPPAAKLTPKHSPAKEASSSSRGATSGPARSASPSGGKSSATSTPRVTPPPSASATPVPTATSASATPAEKHSAGEKHSAPEDGTTTPRTSSGPQDITAEEYKARLAEKRRQAREKAEREAEEERKRQEEARLAEEERMRLEEEEQRRQEEESLRVAAEARKAEEERLQRAIEAEEKRKREEAERLEQEKKAKEEADKKAKEEAERLEKEKQERARREEEERLQRKKKLEMIMKRVKPDASNAGSPASGGGADSSLKAESPTKSMSYSPNVSIVGSSQNSPEEQSKPIVPPAAANEEASEDSHKAAAGTVEEQSSRETTSSPSTVTEQGGESSDAATSGVTVGSTSTSSVMETSMTASSSSVPVFRSASSGDILDGASTHEEFREQDKEELRMSSSVISTPVRSENSKSPAPESVSDGRPKFKSPLLQQLVENKGGDSSSSSSPKFKSPLLQNLLGKTKVGARMGLSASMGDLSQNKDTPGGGSASHNNLSTMASSSDGNSSSGSDKEVSKQGKDEDKDEDTLEANRASGAMTSSVTTKSFDSTMTEGHHGVSNGVAEDSVATSVKFPSSMMSDSALGTSIEPHLDSPSAGPMTQSTVFNGHSEHKNGLEDSSISLHSPEGVSNSASVVTFDAEESTVSRTEEVSGSGQFEELIDLLDNTTAANKSNVLVPGPPIIAFDENRRADVTESLS